MKIENRKFCIRKVVKTGRTKTGRITYIPQAWVKRKVLIFPITESESVLIRQNQRCSQLIDSILNTALPNNIVRFRKGDKKWEDYRG